MKTFSRNNFFELACLDFVDSTFKVKTYKRYFIKHVRNVVYISIFYTIFGCMTIMANQKNPSGNRMGLVC